MLIKFSQTFQANRYIFVCMILAKDEQKIFFTNFYPLLHYAAVYSGLVPEGTVFDVFLKTDLVLHAQSRNAIFQEKDLLDDYASDNARFLNKRLPSFVPALKKAIFSDFIVLKQEKQFGIFMDRKTGLFYHVGAITTPFDEVLKFMPGYCQTALFNFNNRIVWDGLAIQKPKELSPALEQTLLQKYDAALKAKKVIELL